MGHLLVLLTYTGTYQITRGHHTATLSENTYTFSSDHFRLTKFKGENYLMVKDSGQMSCRNNNGYEIGRQSIKVMTSNWILCILGNTLYNQSLFNWQNFTRVHYLEIFHTLVRDKEHKSKHPDLNVTLICPQDCPFYKG